MKDHSEDENIELVGEGITIRDGGFVLAKRLIEFTAVFNSEKEAYEYLQRNRKGLPVQYPLEVSIVHD